MQSARLAIVTDSAADIPPAIAEAVDITIVPNIIVMGEKTVEDDMNFSREEFYANLSKMNPLPTTATPSVGKYQQTYENLLQSGAHFILSIHVSSNLSGIYNAASIAAHEFGNRVRVFDSQSLTLGTGFQCIEVAEAVMQGCQVEQAEEIARQARSKANVIAMLDTLSYVHRSGRVSWTKARIGNLLRLKPFIQVRDGQVLSLGETRTRQKGIDRLINLIRGQGKMKRLAILHTNAQDDAHSILAKLKPDVPPDPLIVNITTVIGIHVGPYGLGFAGLAF
jgi:DegV family protein with EDD domain